ncbi:MAG: sulfotransferase family protein [Solirubrobacteraceae bacterium]
MTRPIDLTRPASFVGTIPDFFVVGHPKCGTTALHQMLKTHPDVYMPDRKEPWFFAEELHEATPPRPEGTPRNLAEYAEWFEGAGPGQTVGEATAYYLWSKTAAANIAQVNPDARIVAILREPASFLRSLHLQLLEVYTEVEPDLGRAMKLEAQRREGRSIPRYTYFPSMLLYSEFVRYAEQLKRFYAVFPADQIKVLIYDDFRADNAQTVREVRRFLGVDDSGPVLELEANPTVRPRSQVLNELVHAVGVGRGPVSHAVKETIKAVTPTGPRRRAMQTLKRRAVFGPAPAPDERVMHELRIRYKDEVVAASECLGRDLVELWGYERLD